MSNKLSCHGCGNAINDRGFMYCDGCHYHYDLECANVSQHTFADLTVVQKQEWRCVICMSKQPKTDNTDTPVRGIRNNITFQRGGAFNYSGNTNMDSEEPMSLNDTAHNVTAEMPDLHSIYMELRAFRDEVLGEIRQNRAQLQQLNDMVTSIVERVTTCETRITDLDERVKVVEQRINTKNLQCVDSALSAKVEELKAELNDRDQDLLHNDLEISCIPEKKGESLSHIVMTLAGKIGVNISDQDLVSVTRVGRAPGYDYDDTATTPKPRPIVVRVARRTIRDQLLQAARVRRGATTEGVDLPGPPRRFYVNERLTKTNRQLFRQARDLKHRFNWRYVWTKNGRIFVREHYDKDSPRYLIRSEADLFRVFGEKEVSATLSAQLLQ